MKIWPVPNCFNLDIPKIGAPGSFWEDRGDRFHCGIDFYAPEGSDVLAIQNGVVIDTGVFTDSNVNEYCHKTFYLILKSPQNVVFKYAELGDVLVEVGDSIIAGQNIGTVGLVINPVRADYTTPAYIHDLISDRHLSMLHLETYIAPITEVRPYSIGNYFGPNKPYSLLDPGLFLNGSGRFIPL